MRKVKILSLIILLLILPFMFGGCWDKVELSEMVIVVGFGIDIDTNNQVKVTLECSHVTQLGGGGNSALFTATGETMYDAIRNASSQINKKLFWGHLQTFVIGRKAAEQGVIQFLNLFYYTQETSPLIYVFIAEGSAEEVFRSKAGVAIYVGDGLAEIINNEKNDGSGKAYPISIQEIMDGSQIKGASITIPAIAVEQVAGGTSGASTSTGGGGSSGGGGGGSSGSGGSGGGGSSGSGGSSGGMSSAQTQQPGQVKISGMAVLDKDTKLDFMIKDKECVATLCWRNLAKSFAIVVEKDNNKINLETARWKLKKKWDSKDKVLNVTVSTQIYIAEMDKYIDFSNRKELDDLENKTEKELEKMLKDAWKKSVKEKSDYLFISQELHDYHNLEWKKLEKKWPEAMKDYKLNVHVKCNIKINREAV